MDAKGVKFQELELKYGVRLVGSDYELEFEGENQLLGFVTTRFVKANSPEEAEQKAVSLIMSDKHLNDMMLANSRFTPSIRMEDMWRESWWKRTGGKGYTFFSMKPSE